MERWTIRGFYGASTYGLRRWGLLTGFKAPPIVGKIVIEAVP
jgi:hypothetical protein